MTESTKDQKSRQNMIEGLKRCTICGEVIETKDVFKHQNKKHPRKIVVMYSSIYKEDL